MRFLPFPRGDDAAARKRRAWLVGAVVAALVLRLAVASFPRYVSGDEYWYTGFARVLVNGETWHTQDGEFVHSPFARPPGYAAWLAGVFAVFGDTSMLPARIVNAVLAAASPLLVAAVAKEAFPRARRTLPVLAAWAQALNFIDVRTVQTLMSENLCTPLCVISVLAALKIARRPTLGRAVVLGLATAGAAYMRADAPFVTVGAGLVAVLVRARRRGLRSAGIGSLAVAAALALSLCLPWCVYMRNITGRTGFMVDGLSARGLRELSGWLSWVSNSYAERRDWLQIYWFGPHEVKTEWIPDSFYRLPGEKEEVHALLARARGAKDPPPEIDAAFAELAARRRAAEPLRFRLVLPAMRITEIWLHPTDDDFPRSMEPRTRSLFSWAQEIAVWIVRPLAGIGFFVAVWWLLRGRRAAGPAVVAAGAVVVRSAAMVWWLPLTTTYGMHEARYVAVVQPVALLLTVAAAHHVLTSRTRRAAA